MINFSLGFSLNYSLEISSFSSFPLKIRVSKIAESNNNIFLSSKFSKYLILNPLVLILVPESKSIFIF